MGIDARTFSHLVLGYNMVAADMLWLRLIQELDFREAKKISKGWAFHMMDTITTLDRRQKVVYSAGITVLNVIVEDIEGAHILYERAIQNYPNDGLLLYKAAYHYMMDMKDCQMAAQLLLRSADHGAPLWVRALAGRLYTTAGQYELARSVLVDSLRRLRGTSTEQRIRDRLKDLDEAQKNHKSTGTIECKR